MNKIHTYHNTASVDSNSVFKFTQCHMPVERQAVLPHVARFRVYFTVGRCFVLLRKIAPVRRGQAMICRDRQRK